MQQALTRRGLLASLAALTGNRVAAAAPERPVYEYLEQSFQPSALLFQLGLYGAQGWLAVDIRPEVDSDAVRVIMARQR